MKKFQVRVILFLGCLFGISGCTSRQPGLTELYQTEVDSKNEDEISPEAESDINMKDSNEKTSAETTEENQIKGTDSVLCVYVCGAVVRPGVYELPAGARIYQAIQAAGGLTEDADLILINQAKRVEDGEQIRIYTIEEAETAKQEQDSNVPGAEVEKKININNAELEVLMMLPGIGEAKALSIIEYRQANGAFQQIEDIKNIPGIKDAVFSKIKDKITV